MADSQIPRLATFAAVDAVTISGTSVQRAADLRRTGHMPAVGREIVVYDLFDLARLALIRVTTARGLGPARLLEGGVGGFATVAIVRAALLCPAAWGSGWDPFSLGAQAWADLVSNTTWHHASRRNLPTEKSGRFLLWWGDGSADLVDDFGPEVWADEPDDRTQSVIVFDTHLIGQSLVQAGRPFVSAHGQSGSEADLGKTAEAVSRPAKISI